MRSRWFGLVVAALAAAVSVWAYPQLPPTVATHWNLRGAPDGFSSRTLAVAIMPAVILVMTGVFRVLPRLDPRGENYTKFIGTYWLFANSVIVFVLIAHGMILATGLGYAVKIDRLMPIGAAGRVPVVVIIAGSGPTDRNGNSMMGIRPNSYAQLAWRLAERGIASLRYDKRGMPGTKGTFDLTKMTLDDFAADAKVAAESLAHDARFTRVLLLG